MSIGIVALSEDREEPETQFYVTDADGDDNDWQAFVSKCNALLKTSAKSHAALVWAAIKYGTTSEKVAEREEFEDCVRAFMGEGWDLDCLGTWKEVKHHYEFNRMVIDKDIEQVFIFVLSFLHQKMQDQDEPYEKPLPKYCRCWFLSLVVFNLAVSGLIPHIQRMGSELGQIRFMLGNLPTRDTLYREQLVNARIDLISNMNNISRPLVAFAQWCVYTTNRQWLPLDGLTTESVIARIQEDCS